MKRRIDLEAAGKAEAFGALAVRNNRKLLHRRVPGFSRAQLRALVQVAASFLQIAKEAGAGHKGIKLRGISIELHETPEEEVLSIRKPLIS